MFKTKDIVFLGILCAFLGGFVSTVNAAGVDDPPLNLQNSGSMGFVPSHARPLTSNVTEDLSEPGTEADVNRVLSTLGCGAVDTHELRKSVLNTDDSTLDQYFNSQVSNYMVTTLFNSPAVAQIFNGLENFAGARVREIQDRCAAMEYKDDLAGAQWQSVQNCIQSYIDDKGSKSTETIALAFKLCLSSPEYVAQNDEDFTNNLLASATGVLESPKWNGTLFGALQNTRLCVQTTGGDKDCSLLAFLPNIRWCTQTNVAEFGHCAKENDDDIETGDAVNEFNISSESLSPTQFFDGVYATTEGFVNYAMVYANALVNQVGYAEALEIATVGENATGQHIDVYASAEDVSAGDFDEGSTDGPGEFPLPENLETAYAQFSNCSAGKDTGSGYEYAVLEWENFNDVVKDPDITDNLFEPIDATDQSVGDVLPGSGSSAFGRGYSESSDNLVLEDGKVISLILLQNYAVKCAISNDVRLTLADYVSLVLKEDSRDAALLGYRAQVAYAATRNTLNFLISRLHLAQLDLGLNVATDPNSPPPYVRNALQTLIDSFENRLRQLENRRQQQKDYASMIAKYHE
jgi:hypothetical protein